MREVSAQWERPYVADQFGALSHDVLVLSFTNFTVAASDTRDKHIEHRQVDDQYAQDVDDESEWGSVYINVTRICKHSLPNCCPRD